MFHSLLSLCYASVTPLSRSCYAQACESFVAAAESAAPTAKHRAQVVVGSDKDTGAEASDRRDDEKRNAKAVA